MSTALATRQSAQLQPIDDAFVKVIQWVAASGYFLEAKEEARAAVKMLIGRELGLPPMASMMGIDIIETKRGPRPRLSANIMAGLIKASGEYDYTSATSATSASVTVLRNNAEGPPTVVGTVTYSIEEARKAGLVREGSPWVHYSPDMLFARAMSRTKRLVPHLFMGLSGDLDVILPEEADDEPMTDNQRRAIFAQLADIMDTEDREQRLTWASDILGREVQSFQTLTRAEAVSLLDWLAPNSQNAYQAGDVGESTVTGKTGGDDRTKWSSDAEKMRAWRASNREKAREQDRARDRGGRYEDNPEQKRAWNLVSDAIRKGRLTKQPCEVCGLQDVQAHHDDYSRPLDVRWLCRPHHEEVHREVDPDQIISVDSPGDAAPRQGTPGETEAGTVASVPVHPWGDGANTGTIPRQPLPVTATSAASSTLYYGRAGKPEAVGGGWQRADPAGHGDPSTAEGSLAGGATVLSDNGDHDRRTELVFKIAAAHSEWHKTMPKGADAWFNGFLAHVKRASLNDCDIEELEAGWDWLVALNRAK